MEVLFYLFQVTNPIHQTPRLDAVQFKNDMEFQARRSNVVDVMKKLKRMISSWGNNDIFWY